MRKGFSEFRVGLFVAAGLVLAMLIIFTVGSNHRLFERQYTVYANFAVISGLRIGAPVQLAGLKVGFVDKIMFPVSLQQKEITVVMKIQKQYMDRIRADSVATIETQGLLGDKFVYVSMGSDDQPVIADGGVIQSKVTTSIFSLAEKAGDIMDNIGKASETINDMLSSVRGKKGEGDLKAILSSTRRTLEQIEKGKGMLHALIYDPNGEKIIANLAETMQSARDIASGAEQDSKTKMGGLISNMRQASADLKVILDSVRNGEGTLGKLVNDPTLYDDLRSLFGRANRNVFLRAVVRSTLEENDRQELK